MKKHIMTIAILMLVVAVVSTAGCKKNDDSENESDNQGDNIPAWVDLGLQSGTLWATCNVGAATPEDYGDYFAWGETEPKTTYSLSNYKHSHGGYNELTKYCHISDYGYNGFVDNLTSLQSADDAATAKLGSGWHIPTKEQWQELYLGTDHTWTTRNGVKGRLFTSSYNGNSIFLPAAGYRKDDGAEDAGQLGRYWSNLLYNGGPYDAWAMIFDSDGCITGRANRQFGRSIRAVRSSRQ